MIVEGLVQRTVLTDRQCWLLMLSLFHHDFMHYNVSHRWKIIRGSKEEGGDAQKMSSQKDRQKDGIHTNVDVLNPSLDDFLKGVQRLPFFGVHLKDVLFCF